MKNLSFKGSIGKIMKSEINFLALPEAFKILIGERYEKLDKGAVKVLKAHKSRFQNGKAPTWEKQAEFLERFGPQVGIKKVRFGWYEI